MTPTEWPLAEYPSSIPPHKARIVPTPAHDAGDDIAWTGRAMDAQGVIRSFFGVPPALVGVVHTGGLPGTPAGDRGIDEIIGTAAAAGIEPRRHAAHTACRRFSMSLAGG